MLGNKMMLQRTVCLQMHPRPESSSCIATHPPKAVQVVLGMWPYCNAQECQAINVQHVCKHTRLVYHQHLGLPWEAKVCNQGCLTITEALSVLGRAAAQQCTTHRLKNLDFAALNGMTCDAVTPRPDSKWDIKVTVGSQECNLVVEDKHLDPVPRRVPSEAVHNHPPPPPVPRRQQPPLAQPQPTIP